MQTPLKIAIGVMVPFVLFISVATAYESTTGLNILTGEKTGDSANEWGEKEFAKIQKPLSNLDAMSSSKVECLGNARCIHGVVTSIIDGDTIKVDSKSVRFALASAPELNEMNGSEARNFIAEICPVGSLITVDEDDKQTQGSYGRIIAMITCNEKNLNEELLDTGLGYLSLEFCNSSEFANDFWAQKHGCSTKYETDESAIQKQTTQNDCEPAYPDFCVPAYPPDLDCGDISQKKFTVLQPDPHRFDGDKDGIGCE